MPGDDIAGFAGDPMAPDSRTRPGLSSLAKLVRQVRLLTLDASVPRCLDALMPSSPNSPFERGAGAELRFELADGRIVGLEHLGFLFELDGAQ